ncbi:HhH-GPD-type base excision DNA repair protein [Saccharothrix syringae]|uniref:Fe-S cluster assembly protein HesB n=1 Tax=Saccharothrix syringae TaxID=103733 RepID=A0A5Q0HB03_SACSY|nr:HhH-GPD-type base excision DNA repair protein [Saccharothrix syringae]QFZ23359.1 Fe-S cluster assembly protein HesB [Saccharothrix syringae]
MSRMVCLAQNPEADELLANDMFALLVGMMLDQQIPMEKAFSGPKVLADRLGAFSPQAIADADADRFAALMAQPPAVHRFPGSMAGRVQALARAVVEGYGGDVTAIWADGDGAAVLKRLKGLPGFGDQKARIFLALLGKQFDVQPDGWREAAGAYGEAGSRRSVADVVDRVSLGEVREFKKAAKAAKK